MNNELIKALEAIVKVTKKQENSLPKELKSKFKTFTWEISKLESEIQFLKKMQEFGLDSDKFYNNSDAWYSGRRNDYLPYSQYLGWYGETRSISWSDDDRQPDNEWLYQISFNSGAYVFINNSDSNLYVKLKPLFDEMFDELKTFKPKYSDTANRCLYFDTSNTKVIHEQIDRIVDKYRARVKPLLLEKEMEELQRKMETLKQQSELMK